MAYGTSCSQAHGITPIGPVPVAVIQGYDDNPKNVDTTGSQGTFVRVVITRGGVVIETTPGVTNDGTTDVPYIITLQNGDLLCVHSSYDNFLTYAVACKQIPTPAFGFVPVT